MDDCGNDGSVWDMKSGESEGREVDERRVRSGG
jgi:hypothetical protein